MHEHILCRSLFVVQQSFLFWGPELLNMLLFLNLLCSIVSDIAPNITTPMPYITVLNGSSVTMTCVLHEGGFPAATIKWMFSDTVISANSKYTITDSDNSTQININIVNTSDAGIYYCQTNNLAGSSTAVIALDVQSKNIYNLSDIYVHKYFTFFAFFFLPSSPWH